jgi:DNA-binding response OmpR family regulator
LVARIGIESEILMSTVSSYEQKSIQVGLARGTLALRGLQIDVVRQQVWIDGILRPDTLTSHELKLLQVLASCSGRICSRAFTVQQVYGTMYSKELDDDRLDALVERTRKKIEDNLRHPRFLRTIHGRGHRLDEYIGQKA